MARATLSSTYGRYLGELDLTPGKVYEVTASRVKGTFTFLDDLGDLRLTQAQAFDFLEGPPVQKPDAVNHPSHYNKGGIECIDALRACMSKEAFRGFLKGNQIKYLWRYESKGKADEDIGKSNWYGEELKKDIKERGE
jgi:hypothetical protein